MFDLNDKSLTKVEGDNAVDRMPLDDEIEREDPEDPLDSHAMHEKHSRLIGYYRHELYRQAENRMEMALDEDYYDNIQWSEEDAQVLRDRGQQPVAYNVIAQTMNWIMGSEKRGRTDFKILPRGKEDAKPAEGKTKFLKYLSDVNRTPFHRSRAFEDSSKVGLGWIEVGAQDEDDGEPIYMRYESWRNMLWDSASQEIDTSDMRYIVRAKWVDEDIAVALFPKRKAQIASAVSESTTYGNYDMVDGDMAMDNSEQEREDGGLQLDVESQKRRRVRLIEFWYREPANVKRLRGGPNNGEVMDEQDPRHTEAVEAGVSVVTEKVMMVTRVAVMTTTCMLFDGESPYRHNRFPFIPVWGYRRGRNGMPYGVVRGLRDIQDNINKRASKALHILTSNKVLIEDNTLSDAMTMDEFAEEIARPDAIIPLKSGGIGRLNIAVDRDLAPAHMDQMSRDIQMIQQVGGVTDEQLGRSTNATSGKAIQARQDQGSLATTKLFDNLRLAVQMEGEIELSLIEQFVTDEKQFRITNMRGTPEFVTLNDGLPENDITRSKADFVISEADWRATMRQAQNEQLTEMMSRLPPEVAMAMLDLVVEGMDVPNSEELVKRIRQINGQRDPDATEPTPEEQQAAQAKSAAEQAQQAMFMAELQLKQAQAGKAAADADKVSIDVDKLNAETAKIKAETERTRRLMVGDSMAAVDQAMLAAQTVITMPTTAKVADNLLVGAGYKSANAGPAAGLPPQMMAPAAPKPEQAPPAPPPQIPQQPPEQAAPPAGDIAMPPQPQ